MTGAVLAGGRSKRMEGRDKSRLTRDGVRVLTGLAGLLREVCGECILVAREEQMQELEALDAGQVYADLFPGRGPLGGLYTALEESEADIFLVACDLPYLTKPLLERIRGAYSALQDRAFALVPRTADLSRVEDPWQPEPLCAIWSRHCRRPAYVALEAEELSVSNFARQVKAHWLDLTVLEAQQLRNINSPRELESGLEIPS